MIFNSQELEQLKAAQALFVKLSKEAAGWRDEYKPDEVSHDRLDVLAVILDDMAVSVGQLFRDHFPGLEGAENSQRVEMSADDFGLDRADTMNHVMRETAAD